MFGCPAYVAGATSPGVGDAVHDISPPLDYQLVLELERWILGGEGIEVFPCGGCYWFSLPTDEHLPNTASDASAHSTFRLGTDGSMMNSWQRWWRRGRRAHPFLEEADMEHVMKLGAWRQLKTYSHLVDELGDAVRPKEAGLQLALRRLREGSHRPLTEAEEHPAPHGIGDVAVSFVVVALLDFLGLLKAMTDVGQERVTFGHCFGHSSHARVTRFIGSDGGRVAAVDHAKWRLL